MKMSCIINKLKLIFIFNNLYFRTILINHLDFLKAFVLNAELKLLFSWGIKLVNGKINLFVIFFLNYFDVSLLSLLK